MKEFKRRYKDNQNIYNEQDIYFGALKPCVFDIETTGLSRENSKIIMTALLVPDSDGYTVVQFLAENHFEENKVLRATLNFIQEENIDYLITFNGESFDIPFFNTRCENVLKMSGINLFNLDIYRLLYSMSNLKGRLPSLKQEAIERFIGIRGIRKDTITGKESISLYNKYVLNSDKIIESVILTHNREDVTQLFAIFKAIKHPSFNENWKSLSFDSAIAEYGFPACKRFSVRSIMCKANSKRCDISQGKNLKIVGSFYKDPFDAVIFEDEKNIRASFSKETRSYEILVPLNSYDEDFFVNIKALELLEKLQGLNNTIGDFFILSEDGVLDYKAINALSKSLVINLVDILEPFTNSPN